MADTITLHASCVDIGGKGVLLIGPPGAGKSDLALRLIDAPGYGVLKSEPLRAELVADDQVILTRTASGLEACAPERLAGLLEIRGHGILRLPFCSHTSVALAVTLQAGDPPARLPAAGADWSALGVDLPLLTLDPALASAAARIRASLQFPPGTVVEAQP